jgi:hypothetical protein
MKNEDIHNVKVEKITKPIQLLAAWLVGLFTIDSSFLLASSTSSAGSWIQGALVIAAIVNVPLFLVAVFILQTKFRPELQEDSYYSTYLSQKTNEPIRININDVQKIETEKRINDLENRINKLTINNFTADNTYKNLIFGINKHLADIESIKQKLATSGVIRITTFGSGEEPKRRVISISKHVQNETINNILKLASELGFQYYNIFDNKVKYPLIS